MATSTPRRADALLNRGRLLDGAEQVIQERGADAPMHEIAARSGLGTGTIYRHFPDRTALFMALVDRFHRALDEHIQGALDLPTGWEKVVAFVDAGVVTTMRHPSLYVVAGWLQEHVEDYQPTQQWNDVVTAAVAEGHAEGSIRSDVGATDIALFPHLLSSLTGLPEPPRTFVITRQRAILLRGIQDGPGSPVPLPGLPLDAQQLISLSGRT